MAILVNGRKVAGLGKPGKSAYQTAVDGGYQGTEEEFNKILSDGATKTFVIETINNMIGTVLEASY